VVEQSAVNRSVVGSNPTCGAILESCPSGRRSTIGNRVDGLRCLKGSNPLLSASFYIIWPLGQAVKTPPFHGGNTGSNPVGVTIFQTNAADAAMRNLSQLPLKLGEASSTRKQLRERGSVLKYVTD
jgi:hypothetical protein